MNTMIFRDMSYGVYVTTSMDGNRPVGCITNSIMQITSDPATIAVSVNHDNYTNSCIDKTGKFAFSILSEKSDPSIIGTFGFHSCRDTDKFSNVDYEMAAGLPVIKDSCGYVVCRVIDTMETQTHTVFLGEVVEAESYGNDSAAMTYAYYHKVIRGKAPKNAPTFLRRTVRRKKAPNHPVMQRKPENGYARYAVMYTKEKSFPQILSARFAARERINSRRWNDRTEPAHLTE